MNRRERMRGPCVFDRRAAPLHEPERGSKDALRCGGAKANDHLRPNQRELGLEPWTARANRLLRAFLRPHFAALFEFEVLHGIRHIDLRPVDRRITQSAIGTALRVPRAGWPANLRRSPGRMAIMTMEALATFSRRLAWRVDKGRSRGDPVRPSAEPAATDAQVSMARLLAPSARALCRPQSLPFVLLPGG